MSDPFRQIPVRLIGYCCAFGECAKYNFTYRTVDALYTIGGIYMVCHAIKCGIDNKLGNVALSVVDSLIFDGIASAIIPCFIAYHLCGLTDSLLSEIDGIPRAVYRWGPFVVGVTAIILMSKKLDEFVDNCLDQTVRTLYK